MSNPKDTGGYLERLDRLEKWTQRLSLLVILAIAIVFANFSLTFVQLIQPTKEAVVFKENEAKSLAEEAPSEPPVPQQTPSTRLARSANLDALPDINKNTNNVVKKILKRITITDYTNPSLACPTYKKGLTHYQHVGPKNEHSSCYYVSEW